MFFVHQIESLRHSHKLEIASVKLECSRSKGEVERERDTLQGQIDGMGLFSFHIHPALSRKRACQKYARKLSSYPTLT